MAYKMKGPFFYKSPLQQKEVDKTLEKEATREDEKMKEIAIKRGWKYKIVENSDGTRKNIKVPVDENGNEIKKD